jgi:hypothetical protein
LSRRRLRTARPALVLMRSRKPWVFARLRLFGWYVLFTVPRFFHVSHSGPRWPAGLQRRRSISITRWPRQSRGHLHTAVQQPSGAAVQTVDKRALVASIADAAVEEIRRPSGRSRRAPRRGPLQASRSSIPRGWVRETPRRSGPFALRVQLPFGGSPNELSPDSPHLGLPPVRHSACVTSISTAGAFIVDNPTKSLHYGCQGNRERSARNTTNRPICGL